MNVSSILIYLAAYLIGSFPSGLVIGRIWKGKDIREFGSRNTGATNAYRVLGLAPGIVVLALDLSKGLISVYLAQSFIGTPASMLIAGVIAVAGHNWPVFLGFNGGRGVATSVGVLLYIMPWEVLILFTIWAIVVYSTRYVSLGSIVGAGVLPFLAHIFENPTEYLLFSIFLALFVIYRHLPNIRRLLAGEENRVGGISDGRED